MIRSSLVLFIVLAALTLVWAGTAPSAPGAEPVVQPTTIPGHFNLTPQPLPAIESVVAAPASDRPVYGLYLWPGEYKQLRKQIKEVGWRQIKLGGPLDDATMRMLVEDDIEILRETTDGLAFDSALKPLKTRPAFASDEAFIEAYLRLLDELLTRYGPGGSFFKENPDMPARPIHVVEVFSEPNFFYMIPDSADWAKDEAAREALYAKILPVAYETIKKKWPTVQVLGFGAGGAGAGDMRFIAHVLGLNKAAAKSMDVLSTHPYVEPVPPETDRVHFWGSYSVAKSLATIRKTLGQHEVGNLPIWYTECGWQISHADGGFFSDRPGEARVRVTPQLQAAYVCRMYALALRLGVPRVHIMFATDTDNFNGGFFLRDGTWRDSARAVQNMIRLMPMPKIVGAGHDGEDGWYAWNFLPDAKAKTPGQPVTMAFAVAGPRKVEVPWPTGSATVVDMLGATRQITASPAKDGKFSLSVEIGPCPIYLVQATPSASVVETGRELPVSATTAPATTAAASNSPAQSGEAPAAVEDAIKEAVKLPPGSGQFFKAAEAALADWVKKSPAEAFEWADKQAAADKRRHYLPLVAMRLWVRQDVPGAVGYVTKLPGNHGLGELASSWAGQDPAAATAWAVKLPREKWPVVIPAVGEAWAGRDPKAAGAWILTLPAEQGCYTYVITAHTWAWSDTAAVAAWVAKLPDCDARADAAAAVVNVWKRKSPGDTEKIKEWVKGFPMPEAKKEQILKQFEKAAEKK